MSGQAKGRTPRHGSDGLVGDEVRLLALEQRRVDAPTALTVRLDPADARKYAKVRAALGLSHVEIVNSGSRLLAFAAYMKGRKTPLVVEIDGVERNVLDFLQIDVNPISDLVQLMAGTETA